MFLSEILPLLITGHVIVSKSTCIANFVTGVCSLIFGLYLDLNFVLSLSYLFFLSGPKCGLLKLAFDRFVFLFFVTVFSCQISRLSDQNLLVEKIDRFGPLFSVA